MRLYTPIEIILLHVVVVLVSIGLVLDNQHLGLRVAGAGVLCWMFLIVMMLYRMFAYIMVVAKSASAMENVNSVIDSLLVSPAKRASRQAAEHAAERAADERTR